MKKHYDVVVYQVDENGRPKRFGDRMLNRFAALGLYKIVDRWSVEDNDGNATAYVYTISGFKFITDYLVKITREPAGEYNDAVIRVDEETGRIYDIRRSQSEQPLL